MTRPTSPAVNFDSVPDDLRCLNRWCLWRYVQKERKDGSKVWTKLPITRAGKPASSTDASTWCSFDEIRDAYLFGTTRNDGVGVTFDGSAPGAGLVDDAFLAELEPRVKPGVSTAELDRFEAWLGDQAFVCGEEISLGDVATHGALTCIQEFPAFEEMMRRPRLAAWYRRVSALRAERRAGAPVTSSSASSAAPRGSSASPPA